MTTLTKQGHSRASARQGSPSSRETPALRLLLADLSKMSSSDLQVAWNKGISLGVLSMAQSMRHE